MRLFHGPFGPLDLNCLVYTGDNKTVQFWDYFSKGSVQTMEGYTKMFHSPLCRCHPDHHQRKLGRNNQDFEQRGLPGGKHSTMLSSALGVFFAEMLIGSTHRNLRHLASTGGLLQVG
jgi:hypothetical protein